ncbi:C4-dicarboxylate ABC transporter substrate-binding protein [Marinobacterium iners]|uniref:TRAP-type C4-dicarboxylate transport system, substrate-binding protein n=2 Tax=Marinobacterium iners TaxID=48076 RepID=A0A1H4FY08_9GAMM|nr:TRAP transporter substrate-binding protein [Marinobacterium iners]QSR36312.1 C4-dicarboxylate ABC transporter substrate-binding protein [Marinobacterium iners]SEB02174.1 TRAP-type C4-dicarboxylate transport system, substrate-binding protein [Marinobacterium iners DSM 11526]
MLTFKRTKIALLACSICLPVMAEPVTLHFATAGPPGHVQNSVVLPTWASWVEEATEGRVKVKLEYNLGDQSTYFSMVEDGVADAAWSFHGYVPGRFQLSEMVELPGLGVNAELASQAYWETYNRYFSDSPEHQGLVLMGLFTHGPGQIHSRKPINSMSDLKGAKIRLGGGVQQELGKRLGITPVAAPGPKVYEMMQQGIVDGVFMPAASQRDFRLAEVSSHLTLLPGGLYLGSFAIIANEDFMDSLSPEDREAIMSVSGARLSAMAGKAWDQSDREGIEMAKKEGVNIHFVDANDPLMKEIQQATSGMDQAWSKKVERDHPDAAEALEHLRHLALELKQKMQGTATSN